MKEMTNVHRMESSVYAVEHTDSGIQEKFFAGGLEDFRKAIEKAKMADERIQSEYTEMIRNAREKSRPAPMRPVGRASIRLEIEADYTDSVTGDVTRRELRYDFVGPSQWKAAEMHWNEIKRAGSKSKQASYGTRK